jgi:hypothetical protein
MTRCLPQDLDVCGISNTGPALKKFFDLNVAHINISVEALSGTFRSSRSTPDFDPLIVAHEASIRV